MAQATESLNSLQEQFKEFLANLTTGRKVIVVGSITIILLGLVSIIFLTQQKTYQSIAKGLSIKESAKIVNQLDAANIPYVIAEGGTSVLVNSDQIDQARLEIASAGILNGGLVGFEIFDKSEITATDFQQNVQFRRALEGELSRLILQIQVVQNARVLLSIPKDTLFSDQEKKATASVQITLDSVNSLSPKYVKTITNLISGAVSGLQPENVKISDQHGNLYTSGSKEGQAAESRSKNFRYQNEIEHYIQRKLLNQLEKIAGAEGVKVNVSAQIDFTVQEIEENIVDPDGAALLSQETINEKAIGSRSIPIGVPGVTSNLPEISSSANEVANVSEKNKSIKRKNFENSKKFIKKKEVAGNIARLNISVLLDDKHLIETEEGSKRYIFKKEKWNADEINQITNIVKKASGFDEARGDQIEVKNIAFAPKVKQIQKEIEIQKQQNIDFWTDIAKFVIVASIATLIIIFLVKPLANKLSQDATDVTSIFQDLEIDANGGVALKENDDDDDDDDLDNTNIPKRQKIIERARKDPQKAATMVKHWLKDAE